MSDTTTCIHCGRPCPQDAIVMAEPAAYAICRQCYTLYNTCNACTNVVTCAFNTHPSPLPKQIQQTIRQGNMTMQSFVKNPERIDITCKIGCHCWSDEFGCGRENNICGNYDEISITEDMINRK